MRKQNKYSAYNIGCVLVMPKVITAYGHDQRQ